MSPKMLSYSHHTDTPCKFPLWVHAVTSSLGESQVNDLLIGRETQQTISSRKQTPSTTQLRRLIDQCCQCPRAPGQHGVALQAIVYWRKRALLLGGESYRHPNIFWNFTFCLESLSSYSCTSSVPSTYPVAKERSSPGFSEMKGKKQSGDCQKTWKHTLPSLMAWIFLFPLASVHNGGTYKLLRDIKGRQLLVASCNPCGESHGYTMDLHPMPTARVSTTADHTPPSPLFPLTIARTSSFRRWAEAWEFSGHLESKPVSWLPWLLIKSGGLMWGCL